MTRREQELQTRNYLKAQGLEPVKLRIRYNCQKWHAINDRNIEWKLTFEEWIDIWIESGKLDKRGRGADKYTMGRVNDEGAYEVGNVIIELGSVNSICKRKDSNGRRKVVMFGTEYESVSAAARANECSSWTVYNRCDSDKYPDCYYVN